ncbi:hypothetical protein NUACC21_52430 [Scytonema sp. NUACC21]
MKQRRNFFQKYTLFDRGFFSRDVLALVLSISVVLVATLYPFNFSLPNDFSIRKIPTQFESTSYFIDQVNNVLLFIPLGFSLGTLLQKIRIPLIGKIIIVLLASAGLSLTVEVLQVFLPTREPTPADILNNTTGGLVGLLCFYLGDSQKLVNTFSRIENSEISQSTQKLTLIFFGYILLTIVLSISWLGITSLSGWNPNYPLLLGNETTGNRPWQGYISKVYIADRAISTKEVAQVFADDQYFDKIGNSLLASYQFTHGCCEPDGTGKSPKLLQKQLWHEQFSETQENKGVFISPGHWLQSATPATSLNKRIRETSELTISTTVASSETGQTGPARIISVSNGALRRNFTLGQQGTDLDLRIRTSLTGENGAEFTLRVPNVFTDTNSHHIVITYSKANLQVYVDNIRNLYSFNLLELMTKAQKLFYYALTFIPLGICLAILTILAKRKLSFYRFLLFSGILLPSAILEFLLVSESGKSISLSNLLIGVLFTTGTVLLLRLRASAMLSKATISR